jgi:hypothetical protein
MAKSQIKDLFEVDEQNRKTVYKRVGSSALLPDDVIGVYDQHRLAIAPHLPDVRGELAGILYAACRKHLALGITSLFRCYSSQAFRETRAAVEAAAVAGAVRRDEESYRILRDDRDEASRKVARNHFKASKIFVGKLSRLQKTYDKASELSHTNRRTFGPNINTAEASFSLQDFANQDIPLLVTNYLIWICGAHMEILEAADVIFPEAQSDLITKFKRERQHVGERLARFNQLNDEERRSTPPRKRF